MGNFSSLKISLIKIGGLGLIAVCGLFLLLLSGSPGWLGSLFLALPIYLFLDWLGRKVFAEKYGWSTSQVGFSVTRIILGVLFVLAFSAVIFWVSQWAS